MTHLVDRQIKSLCTGPKPMIDPFVSETVRMNNGQRCISYGLDSAGYDLRLKDGVKIFSPDSCLPIDPLNFDDSVLVEKFAGKEGFILLPPNTTCLGVAIEHLRLPPTILALIIAKSGYARCGISLNATHGNPGWEGDLVLEITNQTPLPVKIYPNQGIAHTIFFEGGLPEIPYSGRGGNYQGQEGITFPKA